MGNCSSNTLYINTPSQQMASQCANNSSCLNSNVDGGTGLTTPVCCNVPLKKRKCREKVREQIRDLCLLRLGAPTIRIESSEQQVQAAIDLALLEFEEFCGREYFNYYVFNAQPGKSVYQMPPDVGFIRQVFYREQPLVTFNAADVGGVLPIEYYYPGGAYSSIQGGLMDPNTPIYGRAGEWTLYKQYEQMYNRLSSQLGGWEWIDGYCNIKLYPTPCRSNAVIVQYLPVMPDFKRITTVMIEGSYYHMMEMWGNVLGKYINIPGPQGGQQLDGQRLIQDAKEGLEKWRNDLIQKWGDGPQLPILMD